MRDSGETFYRVVVLGLAFASAMALVSGGRALGRGRMTAWTPAGRPMELRGARAAAAGVALCLLSFALAALAVAAWRNS